MLGMGAVYHTMRVMAKVSKMKLNSICGRMRSPMIFKILLNGFYKRNKLPAEEARAPQFPQIFLRTEGNMGVKGEKSTYW